MNKHSLHHTGSSAEDPEYDKEAQKQLLLQFEQMNLKPKTGGEFKFVVPQVVYPNIASPPQEFKFGVDDYDSPAKVITKKKEEVVLDPAEEVVEVQLIFPVKTIAFIFNHKNGKTFVPFNCSFVYNPDDKLQSLEVEKKVEEIQLLAKENNTTCEMIAMTGVSKTKITDIGGLTAGFNSLRFPAAVGTSLWFSQTTEKESPAKPAKKPTKKKSKSSLELPPPLGLPLPDEEEQDFE